MYYYIGCILLLFINPYKDNGPSKQICVWDVVFHISSKLTNTLFIMHLLKYDMICIETIKSVTTSCANLVVRDETECNKHTG